MQEVDIDNNKAYHELLSLKKYVVGLEKNFQAANELAVYWKKMYCELLKQQANERTKDNGENH